MAGSKIPTRCDVAVVCAVMTELTAVKKAAQSTWAAVPVTDDDRYSYESTVIRSSDGQSIHVIAAVATKMGLTPAAVLTTKMILRFRPRLVAMAGVAAGVAKEDRDFGDILVPDVTFDYESGKVTREKDAIRFDRDPAPLDVDSNLISRIVTFGTDEALFAIANAYGGQAPAKKLKLHVGPIGSGAMVVNDRSRIDDIMEFSRKLGGVEMELYAVHRACKDASQPNPLFLGAKSIMDFAENKNDTYKHYAAYTSAEFLFRFLRANWTQLPLPTMRGSREEQNGEAHLNEVLRLGVECLLTLFPATNINGRYFALDHLDGIRVLRRMSNFHVEKAIMTGELGATHFRLDSPLGICEAFNKRRVVFKRIPPPAERTYPPDIAPLIDPEQKWALCAPILNEADPIGVLCFFSRDDVAPTPTVEERAKQVAVATARAFASGLQVAAP